jgi:hypothetical protein
LLGCAPDRSVRKNGKPEPNPPLAFSPAKLLKDRIAGRIVLARFPTLAGSPGRSPSALSDPSWPALACTAVSLLHPPAHRVGADLPCVEGRTCRVPVRCRSRRARALTNSDPPRRSCCERAYQAMPVNKIRFVQCSISKQRDARMANLPRQESEIRRGIMISR